MASQSPDLNPMENLWALIKDEISKNPQKATSLDRLFTIVKDFWEGFPKSKLRELVHSAGQMQGCY